jgi:hypothetical protein
MAIKLYTYNIIRVITMEAIAHSFVSRIQQFTERDIDRINLCMDARNFRVTLFGTKGMTVVRSALNVALRDRSVKDANILYIHVGENDRSGSKSAGSVANHLISKQLTDDHFPAVWIDRQMVFLNFLTCINNKLYRLSGACCNLQTCIARHWSPIHARHWPTS